MDKPVCHYCQNEKVELRPYGPGGSWVCYDCANETPERTAETQNNFYTLMDAASAASETGIVIIGEENGPRGI